jgi:hypothetical protein
MTLGPRARSVWLVLILALSLIGCHRELYEVWVHNRTTATHYLFVSISSATDGYWVRITPSSRGRAFLTPDYALRAFVLLDRDCQEVASGSIDQPTTGIVIDPGGVVTVVPNEDLVLEPRHALHIFEWGDAMSFPCPGSESP